MAEVRVGQAVCYAGQRWTVTATYPIYARLGTLHIVELRHEDGRFEQVQRGNVHTLDERQAEGEGE